MPWRINRLIYLLEQSQNLIQVYEHRGKIGFILQNSPLNLITIQYHQTSFFSVIYLPHGDIQHCTTAGEWTSQHKSFRFSLYHLVSLRRRVPTTWRRLRVSTSWWLINNLILYMDHTALHWVQKLKTHTIPNQAFTVLFCLWLTGRGRTFPAGVVSKKIHSTYHILFLSCLPL